MVSAPRSHFQEGMERNVEYSRKAILPREKDQQ